MLKRLPIFFFVVACLVNLVAWIMGQPAIAAMVKPALMPLLSIACVASALDIRVDSRRLGRLVGAQLFGCAGDILLIGSGFPFFASGIGAFLIGHIFYMTLFGSKSWKGMSWKVWLVSLPVMLACVWGLVKVLKVSGALLPPMAVYGMMLMLLIFCTLCGLIRYRDKATWTFLFFGAIIFTLSDSLIAAQTFEVFEIPQLHFIIMFTYLLAQSFLAIGGFRLCKK